MNKIVIFTSNIAPYRLKWSEELSKYFNVVIYYTKDKEQNYNDAFLKHTSNNCEIIKMKTRKDDGKDHISFDVIEAIKENKGSFIIFDGYGLKTNLLGLLYCKLHRIETWTNVDGYPTIRGKKSHLIEAIKRFTIKNLCDNFFCGGSAVKEHLVSYGANPNKVTVHNFSSINNSQILAKPLEDNEKIKIRNQLGIGYEGNIVLGVGRFIPLKRFSDLIQAIGKCDKECELYLLGGKPTPVYLDLVKDDKKIHFIDFVLPEEVDKYYRMANLFVLPSETDVWGLVLNEAMAQGLPVISSDSPVASHDLVKNNGYVFKTYDIDELSKDIDLCLDKEANKKMSIESLKIIRNFTIEEMVKRQLPIIEGYFSK